MSDRIQFAVSATPIETLASENTPTGDTDIIASEVGVILGGSGDSVTLDGYEDAAATQGYLNATVNYLDITHAAGGTQIRSGTTDFIFIKNTGHKFSSVTALGAVTTDCVMVVIKEVAYSTGVDGGFVSSSDSAEDHFYEVAWLKPGQAIVLPAGAAINTMTQFGSNTNDLSQIGQTSAYGQERIFGRTFQSDGSAATDGNAVEFLAVD